MQSQHRDFTYSPIPLKIITVKVKFSHLLYFDCIGLKICGKKWKQTTARWHFQSSFYSCAISVIVLNKRHRILSVMTTVILLQVKMSLAGIVRFNCYSAFNIAGRTQGYHTFQNLDGGALLSHVCVQRKTVQKENKIKFLQILKKY